MAKWYRDAENDFWRMSKAHGGLQPELPTDEGGGWGKAMPLFLAEDQYGLKPVSESENKVLDAFDQLRPQNTEQRIQLAFRRTRDDVLSLFEHVAEQAREALAITAGRDDLDPETVAEVLSTVDKQRRQAEYLGVDQRATVADGSTSRQAGRDIIG